GDLVFYINSFKSSYLITHSGICLGHGKFIHASASCGVITTDLHAPYWKSRFIFGTRIKS
ncbi:MAG TPA: NlpC/P60 family protein, partial [Cytophagales bacterium]|nr:NlpC/P60 family protein [Cytophagales bacterium]